MSKTLPRWLTNDVLQERGGSYTGIVNNLALKPVRNKFTTETVEEPVMTFTDGYKLIPNIAMLADSEYRLVCSVAALRELVSVSLDLLCTERAANERLRSELYRLRDEYHTVRTARCT